MPILSVFDEAFDMHFKQKMKNEKIYLKLFSTFSVSHVEIYSSEISWSKLDALNMRGSSFFEQEWPSLLVFEIDCHVSIEVVR